jgi:hypothetical protein
LGPYNDTNREIFMRTSILLGPILVVGLGCSHFTTVSGADIVTLGELEENGEIFSEAMRSGKGMIIRIEKGERIPVVITATLPFAQLHAGENSLVATEDFYLYFSKQAALISRDGVSFTPIYDTTGLKKMYGFTRGSASIGFSVSKEVPPSLAVGVTAQ